MGSVSGLEFECVHNGRLSYQTRVASWPPAPRPAPRLPRRWPPGPCTGREVLTEVVRIAEVEHVTAMHVMVEGLLDQVLRLIPGQLGHPEGRRGSVCYTALQTVFRLN